MIGTLHKRKYLYLAGQLGCLSMREDNGQYWWQLWVSGQLQRQVSNGNSLTAG
jgi:hypothetical protein